MPWLAIPKIAIIFVTLQVMGFLLFMSDPAWLGRIALFPERVAACEYWRLVTFLALPLSSGPIWMIFSLWFLFSILNWIESEWGAFKTTLYTLVSILLTILFSMVFSYPVLSVTDFSSTLFLAAAALFPDFEILIYFILPVKMKYLGYLSLAFLVFHLFQGSWLDRLFLITIYSNYLIFFGPSLVYQFKNWKRRRDYHRNLRR